MAGGELQSDDIATPAETAEVPSNRFLDEETKERLITGGFYVFAAAMLLFLWVPLFTLFFLAFAVNTATILPFEGFTLAHMQTTLTDGSLMGSFYTSVQVATISAAIATLLGVLASFGLVRFDFRFKETFRTFGILPLIIPGVILGIGLLIFFRSIVGMTTGFLTLVLTHSVYGFPFVMLPVTARLYGFDRSLEESARDLGADSIESFRDITLPIIAPAIGAGYLFAWIRSFEDFIRAWFVSGPMGVITTEMYGMIKYGFANKMNAMSAFIIVIVAVMLAVAMNLGMVSGYVGSDEDEE
jgi:ABC-type spermidine/putrescine transport system permease subunit II